MLQQAGPGLALQPSALVKLLADLAAGSADDPSSQLQQRALFSLHGARDAAGNSKPTSSPEPEAAAAALQELLTALTHLHARPDALHALPQPPARLTATARQQLAARTASFNAYGETYPDVAAATLRGDSFQAFVGLWPGMAMANHSCR